MERQARLTRFQGQTAISSADYFGRDEGRSSASELDMSAADLVNRLSFQVSLQGSRCTCIHGAVACGILCIPVPHCVCLCRLCRRMLVPHCVCALFVKWRQHSGQDALLAWSSAFFSCI